ncbi:MAG: LemA protein [Candidatus Aldehydirespiratoraceae bacterium]|jgi:LemA protein
MSPLTVAAIVGVVVLGWVIVSFNRFVSQRNLIANSWSNVETELRRRYDLIPNLVETVRGYASHEQDTLTAVIEARQGAIGAHGDAAEQGGPENILVQGLRQLMAVSEDYPDLLASGQFLELQRELVTTEDRIQAARRLFNGNVRGYNRRVESVPSLLIAVVGRFAKANYFEIDEAVRAPRSAKTA